MANTHNKGHMVANTTHNKAYMDMDNYYTHQKADLDMENYYTHNNAYMELANYTPLDSCYHLDSSALRYMAIWCTLSFSI